jgi:hypothetical protein
MACQDKQVQHLSASQKNLYEAQGLVIRYDRLSKWRYGMKKPVKGKPAVLFMTHGGGGRAKQPLEGFAERFFQRVGETLTSNCPVGDESKKRCFELGKELLLKLSVS